MRVRTQRTPTFDELYGAIVALPVGVTGEILEPGVIRTMGRPGRAHRRVMRSLWSELGRLDRERGGREWWIEIEAEVRFPNDRLSVPDLAGWRAEDESAEFLEENPIIRVPDWCCEVLSPTTERDDRRLKLPLYADQGVGWTWLVNPLARFVEVHERRDGVAVLVVRAEGDENAELPPFGPIETSRIWSPAP